MQTTFHALSSNSNTSLVSRGFQLFIAENFLKVIQHEEAAVKNPEIGSESDPHECGHARVIINLLFRRDLSIKIFFNNAAKISACLNGMTRLRP